MILVLAASLLTILDDNCLILEDHTLCFPKPPKMEELIVEAKEEGVDELTPKELSSFYPLDAEAWQGQEVELLGDFLIGEEEMEVFAFAPHEFLEVEISGFASEGPFIHLLVDGDQLFSLSEAPFTISPREVDTLYEVGDRLLLIRYPTLLLPEMEAIEASYLINLSKSTSLMHYLAL